LLLHVLVLLVGIDDVVNEGLGGAIDDSPKTVAFALLLLLLQQLNLHVHEVDLLEKVLNVLILDVEVGVEAQNGRAIVLFRNTV
jgi:hypothetical protein